MSKRLRYTIETLLVNALILSTLYQLFVYLANRRFWQQTPDPPAEPAPSISVVVSLQAKTLDTLALLHLLAVSGPTDDYEVLLVLESTGHAAYPIAQEIAHGYPQTVRLVISGPAGNHVTDMHNFNAGYQAAQGDLIALVDAHTQVNAELWYAALALLDDPAIGAAFAPPLAQEPERRSSSPVPTGGEMLTALHINHARTAGLPFAALSNRVRAMASGFMVFRRSVLDQAGGLLHLLNEADSGIGLGRTIRENGYRIGVLPVPARQRPPAESVNEATQHLLRRLTISRAYLLPDYLAWPFTNPLTVGFILGLITEREGRWWGRRTWWFFVWLRMAVAYELDRIRFGHSFNWTAYAQLFMLDTFIAPALWARALVQKTFVRQGRIYHLAQGGQAVPIKLHE